jgi:hypothetical protein
LPHHQCKAYCHPHTSASLRPYTTLLLSFPATSLLHRHHRFSTSLQQNMSYVISKNPSLLHPYGTCKEIRIVGFSDSDWEEISMTGSQLRVQQRPCVLDVAYTAYSYGIDPGSG